MIIQDILCMGILLSEKGAQLEDYLFKAIMKCGKPEQIYVDYGSIYRAKILGISCAKSGIKLSHSTAGRLVEFDQKK